MKRLYLFRHATAADRIGGLDDFDRPLTDRGRKESERVGAYMKRKAIAIDCVLCSPSVRTRETWKFTAATSGLAPKMIHFPDSLYKEGEEAIYDEVSATADECESIIVVGHNPGLEMFARSLADPENARPKPYRRLTTRFPKGVFVRFKLEIEHWSDLRCGSGRLTLFKTPDDLA